MFLFTVDVPYALETVDVRRSWPTDEGRVGIRLCHSHATEWVQS